MKFILKRRMMNHRSKRNALILGSLVAICMSMGVHSNISSCATEFERYDNESNSCVCKDGFDGLNCRRCRSDAVCDALVANTTCEQDLVYRETSTKFKSYVCDLDLDLHALVNQGKTAMNCDVLGKTCNMLVYEASEGIRGQWTISCNMMGCAFLQNGGSIECDEVVCECSSKCSALTKSMVEGSLSRQPAVLTVDENDHISVQVEGAFIAIGATCQAASCEADPSNAQLIAGRVDGTSVNDDILVTSIVFLVVLGVLSMVSMGCFALVSWPSRGSSLNLTGEQTPVTPVEVPVSIERIYSFADVSCHVPVGTTKGQRAKFRQILFNVSGTIKSGSIMGILGPSGGGKTSLLHALAGIPNGLGARTTGHFDIDGEERSSKFRSQVAFVHQDDSLYSTLTVRECIEYSAALRLPLAMSQEDKVAQVTSVLDELKLEHVANSRIGDSNSERGISGGERRRVSIGMELVTCPQILFLDEPTSGLDSSSAFNIVQILRALAKKNRIVVLSIHQPSAKSFFSIDQIILLSQGRVLYNGSSNNTAEYFKAKGFPCPENENVADHILDLAASGSSALDRFDSAPNVPVNNIPNAEMIDSAPPPESSLSDHGATKQKKKIFMRAMSTLWNEMLVLFKRTLQNLFRNKALMITHFAMSICLGVFGGLIFSDMSYNLKGFQNRSGAFYFTLTFFGFSSFSSLDLFMVDKVIFKRETGSNYYGPFSYFLAKAALEAVFLRIIPIALFSCIFYWMVGFQPTGEHFVVFLMTMVLFNVTAGSISMAISIVAPSVGLGNLIATVVFLVMLLFGGFLLNIDSLSRGVRWLQHFSIFKYAFETLMTNEFRGLVMDLDAPGFPSVPVQGEVFLETLGMNVDDQLENTFALLLIWFIFTVLSYFLLYLHVPQTASKRT